MSRPPGSCRSLAGAALLALVVCTTAAQATPPSRPSTSDGSQVAEPGITATSGVDARHQLHTFGVPRSVWLGAAAALFLLIAGAIGANDRHHKRGPQQPR